MPNPVGPPSAAAGGREALSTWRIEEQVGWDALCHVPDVVMRCAPTWVVLQR